MFCGRRCFVRRCFVWRCSVRRCCDRIRFVGGPVGWFIIISGFIKVTNATTPVGVKEAVVGVKFWSAGIHFLVLALFVA